METIETNVQNVEQVLEKALQDEHLRARMLENGLGMPEELEDRLSLWYCLFGDKWVICMA
ncbi:hypothetical protein COX18_00520 [Candidatus Desantisbacteria bacterium CG23_combo_of_CG06-09_8_20_14_all_40_23]|uniref:Uncharacterized protein n=1 Tax=Candidatus Desantisbacteria bacterium CG23_combo_of_CG06-09_8_20_14_all_40_23 TaxID=1974550 RepID=A0A2H0ACW4_9BACT|nr:MAG: hypothetical protein COX18_00520 [Candidatus Desantisbacteria bacterium CG23_combo_of_CG06-09_8_20_14_all_40_23]